MVPSGLGATLGLYGRLTTEHLGKHIPGNPNVIISRVLAAGTKGAAYAYNAAQTAHILLRLWRHRSLPHFFENEV